MAQTLEDFAARCRAALLADPGPAGRQAVCEVVKEFLKDPEFLDTYVVADAPERKLLYQDPDLGFCILAHSYVGAKGSAPHDHGPSWAIYGQGTGETVMTDYDLLEPATEDKPGKVRPTRNYTLSPGMAFMYNPGDLHAPSRNGSTRLIRIEGIDVSKIKRMKFEVVEPATA
jgi:hypothetical protein